MCENKADGWNVGGIWVVCFLQITDIQSSRYQYVNPLGGMGGIAMCQNLLIYVRDFDKGAETMFFH